MNNEWTDSNDTWMLNERKVSWTLKEEILMIYKSWRKWFNCFMNAEGTDSNSPWTIIELIQMTHKCSTNWYKCFINVEQTDSNDPWTTIELNEKLTKCRIIVNDMNGSVKLTNLLNCLTKCIRLVEGLYSGLTNATRIQFPYKTLWYS